MCPSTGPGPELSAKAGSAAEEPARLAVGATQGEKVQEDSERACVWSAERQRRT